MQIRYLDGIRLKRALIAGSRRVLRFREQLNKINVFPVADSDTGTNMAGTLRAMIDGIGGSSEQDVSVVSRMAAESALMGARGNSGTILSQFFFGIAEEIEDRARINTRAFSRIVRRAVDHTYEALSEPVEGTILTVLRAWSNRLEEISHRTSDFARLLSESLEHAKTSLRETRKKLPSLRKAKVVDAGALGMVHLIEGIVNFIEKGKIREVEQGVGLDLIEEPAAAGIEDTVGYRYCTECMIESAGRDIDHAVLRGSLEKMGDSLIVAGSAERTKVHVHTDDPEEVFRIAGEYGVLSQQKVDDMEKQYQAAHAADTETALVVDSACDLPEELMKKCFVHMVPVRVIFGEQSYLDKSALSPARFYELLRSWTDTPGTTSQPATGDFEKTFAFLTAHYKSVVYLGLSEALSGTVASARSALGRIKAKEAVSIIDSKNVTVGAGLIARRAVEWIEAGRPIEAIRAGIEDLVERTRLLITIPSLDALIRSGRLGKTRGLIAELLRLRPLLTIDGQGKVVKAAMVHGAEAGKERIISMIRSSLGEGGKSDFAVAHVDNREIAEWFRARIEEHFNPARNIFILDASPALATHTGFGTAAVAYFEPSGEGGSAQEADSDGTAGTACTAAPDRTGEGIE